ncbi:alcohol dehydrogenase zinc-binding domain-containing protein [Hyphomicrobium denitrificans 1NES1]|uniref:Alcohol dehydrogenase zinc-binding domain-containing protein n=2 Tax=Hyphomicrobium denitrificans TaxID=53399 RepID=N0B6P9_9HYPH|nr:alcohol dehydrogenase zinc-binding domain-containing protein [Hyphomicrobium denitrificans 1NES1]
MPVGAGGDSPAGCHRPKILHKRSHDMAYAVRVHAYGGPEVLTYEDVEVGPPGPGEVLLKQHAVGVNFIDIYQRDGLYKLPSLPAILGSEGAGEVIAVGPKVEDFKVGDRAAYGSVPGAYAEVRRVPADKLIKLPDGISYDAAAAMMLQGMTARYLLRETYKVGPETIMLFHAAAGGVGLIVCQWARALGATIIGTVSTDEKAELARSYGCTHTINTKREDFVARVSELTNGAGCDVVYDSVGKDTFPKSLDCLKPKGLWVSFGNSSGPVPPFELTALKGSLFATRPSLFAYTAKREDLEQNAAELFAMVLAGKIKIAVNHRYALRAADKAHRDLAARRTAGSIILVP